MASREEETKKSCSEKFSAGCHGFCAFLYNKETGQVMGRDCKSWAKIGIFYVIYYSCLAGFFAAMLAVFLQTLNKPGKGGPKLTQYLDKGPGLKTILGHIKEFSPNKSDTYKLEVAAINKFLGGINTKDHSTTDCPISSQGYSGNVPCAFNMSLLEGCSGIDDKTYGFSKNAPCQIVAINKVFGWVPKNYGSAYLTLKCDVKAGDGRVAVYPPGFLISSFPYKGQSFYTTPPVAVQVFLKGRSSARVRCFLSGEGIKTAEFFDASRGFANVDFKVTPL